MGRQNVIFFSLAIFIISSPYSSSIKIARFSLCLYSLYMFEKALKISFFASLILSGFFKIFSNEDLWSNAKIYNSVSYTHLDVYKRQVEYTGMVHCT